MYKDIIEKVVTESKEHLTAEQVFLKAKRLTPKISMATVYNNLNNLIREKRIKKIATSDGADRFDNLIPHAHLVCEKCGGITDVMLDDICDDLSTKLGIDVTSYDLKINYVCPKCSRRSRC